MTTSERRSTTPTGHFRRTRGGPLRLVGMFVSVAVGVVYLLPLIWVTSLSVRTSSDAFSNRILPHSFRLDNFADAWRKYGLRVLFENTILVTGGTVLIGVALAALGAYGFSRYQSRITEPIFLLILAGLMIPPAAIIVPFFLAMENLGLYNRLIAVILGEVAFVLPLGVLLLRGYIDQLPIELTDAARVDGASDFKAFWYVAFPLLRPAVATVALFFAISTWNGFLLPLVLLREGSESTLTVGLAQFLGQYGQIEIELVSAASLMAVVPLLVVFIAARRYYVQGLSAGAIKQ